MSDYRGADQGGGSVENIFLNWKAYSASSGASERGSYQGYSPTASRSEKN